MVMWQLDTRKSRVEELEATRRMRRRVGHDTGDQDAQDAAVPQPLSRSSAQRGDSGGDPGVAIVKALAGRAWQSPKVKTGVGLWAIGMLFMLVLPGLHTVTPEMKQEYETRLVKAANMPEFQEAYANYVEAQAYTDEAKVWFWRFREPYSHIVPERQRVADKWQAEMEKYDAIREKKMREAKAYVGLWSDFGMAEVRQRFWDAYDKGKVFAQQQTFYHMLVQVLTTRDDEVLGTIINWVFVAVINFTTGLLGSLFYFLFSVVSMVFTYQPDPFSGVAFVVLAFVGGASVIASYLFAIYGMVASSAYVVGKVIVRDALEQGRQQQRLQRERWE